MLTLTDDATDAIHGLVGDRPDAGLRIFLQEAEADHVQLGLAISEGPHMDDEVVEQSGCKVFVENQVAPLIDGRTLDADASDEGHQYRFSFEE